MVTLTASPAHRLAPRLRTPPAPPDEVAAAVPRVAAAAAGFDVTPCYREQTITALLGCGGFGSALPAVAEAQPPAGSIESGAFFAVTHQPLDLRDELVWNGDVYRVESESVEARIAGTEVARVKQGMK